MELVPKLIGWATRLRQDIYAINLARNDLRVPWHTTVLAVCVVGYAISPIDLIPDFIPVLGLIDDLIIISLGIAIVIKLIPAEVMSECRQKAIEVSHRTKQKNWIAGGIIIAIWVAIVALLLKFLTAELRRWEATSPVIG